MSDALEKFDESQEMTFWDHMAGRLVPGEELPNYRMTEKQREFMESPDLKGKPHTVVDLQLINEAMERAPQWVACWKCDGTRGSIGPGPNEVTPCPICRGRGRVER